PPEPPARAGPSIIGLFPAAHADRPSRRLPLWPRPRLCGLLRPFHRHRPARTRCPIAHALALQRLRARRRGAPAGHLARQHPPGQARPRARREVAGPAGARAPVGRCRTRRGRVRGAFAQRRPRPAPARAQPLRARRWRLVLRGRRLHHERQAMNFDAILFDCDGVLVDSEPITNGVLREVLNEAGWAIAREECEALFIGRAVRDLRDRIEAETGRPLTDAWMHAFYERRNARLRAELKAIDGVHEAVAHLHERVAGRIACASGADRPKVVMQLEQVGLAPYFGDAIFSGHDLPRSKPAPDVYLA